MTQRRSLEDLTAAELRQLLMEKRRNERQRRLDYFRRTGRVIFVEPAASPSNGQLFPSGPAAEPLLAEDIPAARTSRARSWFDRLLVVVEIAAVLGLAWVIFSGVQLVQALNREVASALIVPTPSPTPLISAVVLPSGHTPPRNGATRFNEAEVPSHLRPMVQAMTEYIAPTPGPRHAQNIKIPAINVFAPVVQGDGWEQLKKGVGQHPGTPNPGDPGNLVLSAHNDVFGELFRDLDQLKPGDEVILYTQEKTITYIVRETKIVEPTAVEVMAPSSETVVTLISCYPYLVDNQRIVVVAEQHNSN